MIISHTITPAKALVVLALCALNACSGFNDHVLKNQAADSDIQSPAATEPKIGEHDSKTDDDSDDRNLSQALDALCFLPKLDDTELAKWRELDLLDRIRHGFQLNPYSAVDLKNRRRVDAELKWLKKHPEYIGRVVKRAQPYWFFIVEELDKRGMPLEIAFLPIVESGFDPFAYSPGRASGMWQIIPGTGRELGLSKTWWHDERRDIIASTEAALDYLMRLNRRFKGDWLLALAAYNSGGTRVQRAVNKNQKAGKPVDFWNLKLPSETKSYVPRLLALVELFSNLERYAIQVPTVVNAPYFSSVDIGGQLDLAQASELAGITIDDIYQLNPALNRWATPPNGPHRLLIPLMQRSTFVSALAELPKDQRVTWRRHKIKRGETLSQIAEKYKISSKTLQTANNLSSSRIREGQTLVVPSASKNSRHYSYSLEQRQLKTQNRKRFTGRNKHVHRVARGDTFWSISRRYKVSTAELARWNNMSPKDLLRVGTKLVVWTREPVYASANGSDGPIRKVAYRVRKGDSLAKIAGKFRVSINDIARWNSINKQRYIQPGQPLVLYVDVKG